MPSIFNASSVLAEGPSVGQMFCSDSCPVASLQYACAPPACHSTYGFHCPSLELGLLWQVTPLMCQLSYSTCAASEGTVLGDTVAASSRVIICSVFGRMWLVRLLVTGYEAPSGLTGGTLWLCHRAHVHMLPCISVVVDAMGGWRQPWLAPAAHAVTPFNLAGTATCLVESPGTSKLVCFQYRVDVRQNME
jgi:hypothetical protein